MRARRAETAARRERAAGRRGAWRAGGSAQLASVVCSPTAPAARPRSAAEGHAQILPLVFLDPGQAQLLASSARLGATGTNAVCTEASAMAAWKACSDAADESTRQSASLSALNHTAPTTRGLARILA